MIDVIRRLYAIGPLLFAVGFLTPLTAQVIELIGWVPPWGLSPLLFGLIVSLTWGVIAQLRGRRWV